MKIVSGRQGQPPRVCKRQLAETPPAGRSQACRCQTWAASAPFSAHQEKADGASRLSGDRKPFVLLCCYALFHPATLSPLLKGKGSHNVKVAGFLWIEVSRLRWLQVCFHQWSQGCAALISGMPAFTVTLIWTINISIQRKVALKKHIMFCPLLHLISTTNPLPVFYLKLAYLQKAQSCCQAGAGAIPEIRSED